MKGTAWRVCLGIGALATGAYYLLTFDPAGAVLNVVGVRWHRPVRRLPWVLIAAAQGLLVALLALSRSTGRDWAGLTDAAIIAIGFGLLSWMLVMVPYFQDRRSGWSSCWCRWPTRSGTCSCWPWRPGWATVSTAVTDGMYLVDYLLLGAAGLHRSMAGLSEPSRWRQSRLGRGRLLAMRAAALVAPALLILQRLRGSDIEVAAIAGAWAVLFVLVMTCMAGLVRAIEQAEAERRRVLDRTVQAAKEERMHVATELHDGPSSAWPCSPTTWNGPSSGCSATRRPWPASSTPRPPCRPRSRACGS